MTTHLSNSVYLLISSLLRRRRFCCTAVCYHQAYWSNIKFSMRLSLLLGSLVQQVVAFKKVDFVKNFSRL